MFTLVPDYAVKDHSRLIGYTVWEAKDGITQWRAIRRFRISERTSPGLVHIRAQNFCNTQNVFAGVRTGPVFKATDPRDTR